MRHGNSPRHGGRRLRLPALCAAAIGIAVLPTVADAVITPTRTIAAGGTVAPGTSGAAFDLFNPAVINAAGDVAFVGTLDLPGFNPESFGIWSTSGGGLGLAVRGGTVAPGTGGAGTFGFLSFVHLNDAGNLTFRAPLNGVSSSEDTGLWSTAGGSLGLVVREGAPVPGVTDAVFKDFSGSSFFNVPVNASGQLAFQTDYRGVGASTPDGAGVFSTVAGSLQAVAIDDQTMINGDTARYQLHGMTDNGHLLLIANRASISKSYLFTADPTNSFTIQQETGEAVPGVPGADLDGFGSGQAINNAGDIAFGGRLDGSIEDILWSTNHGLIARDGTSAPGSGNPTYSFINGPTPVGLSSAGEVLFYSDVVVSGTELFSFFKTRNGVPVLVAREGDAAPGITGATFKGQVGASHSWFNAAGDVVFFADVDTPGGTESGLWFYDESSGGLRLLLRPGQQIDLDGDPVGEDLRTINFIKNNLTAIGGRGLDAGYFAPLNDAGEFVVTLAFTNGSQGVVVLDLNQFPGGPGDFNNDGFINAADIDAYITEIPGTVPPSDARFDLDGDNDIDLDDNAFLIANLVETSEGNGTFGGDANLDGSVDFSDFLVLQTTFGTPGGWADGDYNADGNVDFSDFLVLQTNFGLGGGASSAAEVAALEAFAAANIPEPASLALLGLGCLCLPMRRTR